MFSNSEFAQITGIPQDAMGALPPLGAHLCRELSFAEFALFTIPVVEVNGATHDLWAVKRQSATRMGLDARGEEASWAKEEERRRKENLAHYIELAEKGFCDGEEVEELEVSLTDCALHRKGEG